jgi:hypothetical protein
LLGCWEAKDSTVQIFRKDGSFIGRDFHGRRIFGAWSELNKSQIGFQSLYHSGSYNPQYAEVTNTGMRYAYADGAGFADCIKIDLPTALLKVNSASLNQWQQPAEKNNP